MIAVHRFYRKAVDPSVRRNRVELERKSSRSIVVGSFIRGFMDVGTPRRVGHGLTRLKD